MPCLQMGVAAIGAVLFVLDAPEDAVIFFFLLCMVLFMRTDHRNRFRIAASFFLFFAAASFHESRHVSSFTGAETAWHITFKDDIHMDGDRLYAEVKEETTGETLRLTYRIKTVKEKIQLAEQLVPGRVCRLKAKAAKPNKARNDGEFDYRAYLATMHIFFVLTPESPFIDQCTMNQSLLYKPAQWRAAALKHIYSQFPAPLSLAGAALLFGDRSSTPQEIQEDYERLGIVHILAISGLHVTLLTGLLFYLLIRIGVTREKSWMLLVFGLPVYALLTGASPPVVRACLTTGAVLAAASSGIYLKPSTALGAAFLLMVFVNPYSLFQAGFQLSFAVTWALVLSSGSIFKKSLSFIQLSFSVSILAQLAALPILMVHFAEISMIAPLANLIFVPFYSLFMLPLLVVLFFFSCFVPISIAAGPANELLEIMNHLAAKMADVPFAVLVTGQPEMKTVVLSAAVVILSFFLWETSRGTYSFFCCGLLLAGIISAERFSSNGEIVFLDVGQGDSIFIKLPFNQGTYLIDTGGQLPFKKEEWMDRQSEFSVGENTIIPFLKRKGITKLDKLILTHADFDHAGAAAEVLSSIPAKEVVISPGSGQNNLISEIISMGIPVREGWEGENWSAGEAFFQFLSPGDREYNGNNDSLVLYAKIGGKTWLFTGDMEEAGERELREKYQIDIDWLKAGHHGSRSSTSSEFIEAVQPEYAVISAGVNNRYGHPHQEVLDTLAAAGVHVYRTDKHGSISYQFNGKKNSVSTSIPVK